MPLPPTTIERLAGSPATEVALTALGAAVGGVLAPLLPVLAKSLAAKRQEARVELALRELDHLFASHEQRIQELTDGQYKLINECVLAVFQATDAGKIAHLKQAVQNCLTVAEIDDSEAVIVSRMIRDLSAEEIVFLKNNFQYKGGVRLVEATEATIDGPDTLRIPLNSRDALLVSGLISLGILVPSEAGWGGVGNMTFSRPCAKLLALLQSKAPSLDEPDPVRQTS
jgi:hypothetical protein